MRGHLPDIFPSSGAQARHLPPKGEGFPEGTQLCVPYKPTENPQSTR